MSRGRSWVRGEVSCSRDDARDSRLLEVVILMVAVAIAGMLLEPMTEGMLRRAATTVGVVTGGGALVLLIASLRRRDR